MDGAPEKIAPIKNGSFQNNSEKKVNTPQNNISGLQSNTPETNINNRNISDVETDNCSFACKILLTIPLFIIGTVFGFIYGLICGLATAPCSCYEIIHADCSPETVCVTPSLCCTFSIIMSVCWTVDGLFSGGYLFCSKLWNDRPIFIPSRIRCLPPLLNTPCVKCFGMAYSSQ